MDLKGKVALVTGGAIRVGRAIVLALAAEGTDVIINYHGSEREALATAEQVREMGRRAFPYRADMSNGAEVRDLVARGVEELGRLDVLVNSASLWLRTPWAEIDEAAWDRVLDTNLKGPFLCARAAAPHLALHGEGAVVNIVDLSAWSPFPNFLAHSAAKGGLLNMTYALARELAPAVRVNAIAPGPILPPPDYTEEQVAAKARATLLKRWGKPEDVGQAVVYLARADYVTGAVIHVDGGEHLKG